MDNSSLTTGATISHYRIVQKIGAGGWTEFIMVKDLRLCDKITLG